MLANIVWILVISYFMYKFPVVAGIVGSILTGLGIAISHFFIKSMFFWSPSDPPNLFNDFTLTLWFLSSLFLTIPMINFIKRNNKKGNDIF